MKKLIALSLLAMAFCGCRNLTATLPGGAKITSKSFMNKLAIGSLIVGTNGTVTLSGYNLDQTQIVLAAFQLGLQAAKSGLVP